MNKLMIGFVGAMALVACGSKKKGGDSLAKMEEFQKKMCDCKDKACSDKVTEEMTKWGAEMAKNAKPGDAEKPDPEMAKKSADIMQKYTDCMTKNMMAGAGGSGGSGGGSGGAGGSGDAGSGAGGSGGGSANADAGSDAGSNHKPGSGGDDGSHKEPDPGVAFGEKLPDHWVHTGHQLDHVEEAPKDAKWTAEFAHYVFDVGKDDKTMPKDPKEYAATLEKSGVHEKVTKTDKLKNGYYYESEHAFRYVIDVGGDERIHCGGSLYKDPEHDKIAKIRDGVVATAKKLCASVKKK